ncbi:CocE/NonD family hydrolase [Amycolatopsis sp. NPDC004378]
MSSVPVRSRSAWGTARRNLSRVMRPGVTITPPPRDVQFERDAEVPTRDATVLRANVFRPPDRAGGGRFPVLLCAQPYGKDVLPKRTPFGYVTPLQYRLAANSEPMTISAWTALEAPDPAVWVPRGYVVVVLDLRGWGHSDGDPESFALTEGQDVHDAIEWAAAQPWSTGRVGMTGVSYLAITQWTAAATRPPHLAAINPWEGFTDPYTDFFYPGGIRENGFATVWSAWQRAMRPSSGSFRARQKRHPHRDAWWAARSPDLEKIDVPALVCGSFSDHSLHSRGSFEGFRQISSTHKWLYTHRGPKWSTYYGPAALEAQFAFFDHFLRGEDTAITETAPVRVEIRDSLRDVVAVRGSDSWPPADAVSDTRYLDVTDGTLGVVPPSATASVEIGSDTGSSACFSWQLEESLDIVGPMRLCVTVSADHDDLTLFAAVRKLRGEREVVFEGSYGFTEDLVTRGWLRASHRDVDPTRGTDWEAAHPHTEVKHLVPGEPAELDLTLLPSATRFAAGDTLVLELRDHWFFPANPITGQFPAVYERSPRQGWRIHSSPDCPATLTVSVWHSEPDSVHRPVLH